MAKAESSAAAAKNGIKSNVNVNVNGAAAGATYDLPWYAFSPPPPSLSLLLIPS